MIPKEDKKNLLHATETEYAKLKELIEAFDEASAESCTPDGYSAKQLVGNLAAWIGLFFGWCTVSSAGDRPSIPKLGYAWHEQRRLDADIWFAQQSKGWSELVEELSAQYERLIEYLRSQDDADLYGGPLSLEWAWTKGRLAEMSGAERFRAARHILWKHAIQVQIRTLKP